MLITRRALSKTAFIHTTSILSNSKPNEYKSVKSAESEIVNPHLLSTQLDLTRLRANTHHTPLHPKQPLTPISSHIKQLIKLTGPVSLATFMRQALTSPHAQSGGGYYMTKDVFGTKGDFTTAPDISQLFGEMVGVWVHSQWQNLGKAGKVGIVEIGPGRGTLMHDVLRVLSKTAMRTCEVSVHLVEPSPALRQIQKDKLAKVTFIQEDGMREDSGRVPINWYDSHEDLPELTCPIVLLHELYDALPVHRFVLSAEGKWEEVMVDIDTSESPLHFRFVVSPSETDASAALLNANLERYAPDLYKQGSMIEVSPESWNLTSSLATMVSNSRGSCLIVDYGTVTVPQNTLRGIRKHEFCDPLEGVGEHDLSCDVDFGLIKGCVGEVDVEYFGPIDQGTFLERMGIKERLRLLNENEALSVEEKESLKAGVDRVIAMGADRYKVMAMQPSGLQVPFAFQRIEKKV